MGVPTPVCSPTRSRLCGCRLGFDTFSTEEDFFPVSLDTMKRDEKKTRETPHVVGVGATSTGAAPTSSLMPYPPPPR